MTTLVTGATGVVGVPLVRALLDRGDELRLLVRPDSDVEVLPGVEMDIMDGDVTDRADVEEAVRGCERVFHLAGLFKDTAESESVFFDVNVGGTVNIMQAALDHSVEKVVVVSSASTIGEGRGETGTEETEHRGYFMSPYERSKWEAEQFVAEFVAKGVPAVIVNPSLVYGPGDSEHNGGRLTGLLNGVITASVDAPAAYVFVDDLIRGILAADEIGRPGERYLLSGTNTTRIEFLRTAAAIAGVDPALRVAAPWQLKFFLWLEAFRGRFGKRAPLLTRSAVESALHGARYDSAKAESEFGLEFTALEEGLDETIEWLYQEGKIELSDDVLPDDDHGVSDGDAGVVDDDGWEVVELEDGEPLPDHDDEWEWEEEEDEDEDETEGEDVVAEADESGWEWVEAGDEKPLPKDDDEWEWEEVDDDEADSPPESDGADRNGSRSR